MACLFNYSSRIESMFWNKSWIAAKRVGNEWSNNEQPSIQRLMDRKSAIEQEV